MRQLTSKLNIFSRSAMVMSRDMNKVILNAILWSFAAFAFSYVFLLGNMVLNIVERQGLEARARSLTTEVRDLEVIYLSMSNDVDLELSHSLGFKEAKPVFATRKSLGFAPSGGYFGNIKATKNDF